MTAEPVVSIRNVNYWYGTGPLRRQVLFDVSTDINPGEIVLLTGPSGSGKTTLLTLAGGLRAVEEGSVRIFGEELRGASQRKLVNIRKSIGFVFQAHNLIGALTAAQNVQMSLGLDRTLSRQEALARSLAMLKEVGLADHAFKRPGQLSGGQKQRVAIARAVVRKPRIILADEPTAALDRKSGREISELLKGLARQQGCAILLVTHDNRILDLADRVIVLEDGRLESFAASIATNTGTLMHAIAQIQSRGDLSGHIARLSPSRFLELLDQMVAEFDQFVRVINVGSRETVQVFADQFLDAVTVKVREMLCADRATLFLVDHAAGQLRSRVALGEDGRRLDIRIPLTTGIAGRVARNKRAENIPDPYSDPDFNPSIDRETGYRTRNILCMPIFDRSGEVFAVAQMLNGENGPFTEANERDFFEFSEPLGVILESSHILDRLRAQQADPDR